MSQRNQIPTTTTRLRSFARSALPPLCFFACAGDPNSEHTSDSLSGTTTDAASGSSSLTTAISTDNTGDETNNSGGTDSESGPTETSSGPTDTNVDTSDTGNDSEDTNSDTEDPAEPCTTRVSYGNTWIHPPNHPEAYDDVDGPVSWNGECHYDGQNSYAALSNGWMPYFEGRGSCLIALDSEGSCDPAPPSACTTTISYGGTWLPPDNHPESYDIVAGVVTWDGECDAAGGNTVRAALSNGWAPHFAGACELSFRYEQCGGLYNNPVVAVDCPDPGVTRDGDLYVMACTGGGGGGVYPLRTSTDLVHWQGAEAIFPNGNFPSWASGSFWAPELHHIGSHWVAYFSARNSGDNSLALGAATAPQATGPWTDIGQPLLTDPSPGIIDAHAFIDQGGNPWLAWKLDGNAINQPTPIFVQPLNPEGTAVTGQRTQVLSNTLGWEGPLIEGPWVIHRNGRYYLFYSASYYASSSYAVGVARSNNPTGPWEKHGDPILVSNKTFAGPGHGSVLQTPSGDWVHVYHSWLSGHIGENPGRVVLVDRIAWRDGWPTMSAAPGSRSQPMPR